MQLRWLFSLFAIFVAASWSYANELEEPNAWLEKMSRSHRELNYQGLFTYEQADSIQTMRIFHALIEGQEYERIERLNSTELNLVRRGHGPRCMHVGDKLIRLLKDQRHSKAGMAHFYDFSVVAKDRVADREVVELAVMPRDKHRFGHRLSLDKETGLLLRAIQYSPDNKVLERFQFVEVDYQSTMSLADFEGHDKQQRARHIDPHGKASDYPWSLSWMPGGFKPSPHKSRKGIEKLTFTDGLAVFSVFVEPHQRNKPSAGVQGRAQRGATMAYSRAFQLDGRPYRVTVVGEIPQATAERIAASVVASG